MIRKTKIQVSADLFQVENGARDAARQYIKTALQQ